MSKQYSYKMKSYKRLILIAFSVFFVLFLTFSIYVYFTLESKINATENVELTIEKNSSISQIIQQLNQQNMLKPNWLFEIIAKSYAYWTKKSIFAGVHKFSADLTNAELIAALFNGKNLLVKKVTFPEGITLKRFAAILQKQLDIDSTGFMQLCYDKNFIDDLIKKLDLNIEIDNLEGYLMPATFTFFAEISAEKIISTLVEEQMKILKRNENAAEKIGFSYHETLTLASIIEAETPVIAERKTISGVYHNRLKKNMLLQADPTVLYALEIQNGSSKKRLLYSDLKIDNRYNTYKYVGLPPGPINSPSPSSIEAAVNPEKHTYLFFVAVGDGSNRHNFSKNYSEHQQQVAKFRRNRN
jgi:UPF0755 protein